MIDANQLKAGMKLELENVPYNIVSVELVKPGKGQSFTRTKLKNLKTQRVIERTFKANEKLQIADVNETKMRLLYTETDSAVFMDETSYEQIHIPLSALEEHKNWLKEDTLYDVVFYKGDAVDITPPTFMDLLITETAPGIRGDTASGRVMKPCTVETGAQIQIPIFIEEGENIRVDTRTGEYVGRS